MKHLIYGNNHYLAELKLSELLNVARSQKFEIEKIYLSEISNIKDINLTTDLFATPKLYIFEDIFELKDTEQFALLNYLESLDNPNIIFFVRESIRSDSKLLKEFMNLKFEIFKFELDKSDYQRDMNAIKFVNDELRILNVNFESNIPRIIVNQIGNDSQILHNEVAKLQALNKSSVSEDDIRNYLVRNIDANSFQLLDMIMKPNQDLKETIDYVIQDIKSFTMFMGLLTKKIGELVLFQNSANMKSLFEYLLDLDYMVKTGKLNDEKTAIYLFYMKLHEK